MKFVVFFVTGSLIFFACRCAWSAGEVQSQLDQMKTNEENSEKNKESYEKNQKIAEQNVKAIEENLKGLSDQRNQIRENVRKADQNIATMGKQEVQIQELMKKENMGIESEKKQIEALEQKVAQLKANTLKRQENQTQYQTRLETITKEKQEWAEQKKSAQDLEKAIDEKEKHANADKAEWKKKSQAYAAEVRKWSAEADTNRATHKKYQKLNN